MAKRILTDQCSISNWTLNIFGFNIVERASQRVAFGETTSTKQKTDNLRIYK